MQVYVLYSGTTEFRSITNGPRMVRKYETVLKNIEGVFTNEEEARQAADLARTQTSDYELEYTVSASNLFTDEFTKFALKGTP